MTRYILALLFACLSQGVVGDPLPMAEDGRARLLLPDGSEYEGEIHAGLMEGRGVLVWPNGDRYEGDFHQGMMEGHGKLVERSGGVYIGEFRNGAMTGEGVYLFANGDLYSGDFLDGYFHGRGMITYHNGDQYFGDFRDNLFHGQGVYVFAPRKGRGRRRLAGRWEEGALVDPAVGTEDHPGPAALVPELLLFRQPMILARNLARVMDGRPGVPDLYLLVFGGDGSQDVFMKEAEYVTRLFRDSYGVAGRSLLLVNNRKTLSDLPLASATNLRAAIKGMARHMDPEEDLLFIYLTSHGSRDPSLTVRLENVPLVDITPGMLKRFLAEAGVRWKVIVISACYSGAFIKAFSDDVGAMVITSARADHTSFGCSDDANMTYFGRAFFEQALPQSQSFRAAFARANELVTRWEQKEGFIPSRPQLHSGADIEARLAAWRRTLEQGHTPAAISRP